MRRTLQVVFTLLSTLCLLLTTALWIRSYYVLDTLSRSTPRGDTIFQSHRGRLSWRSTTWPQDPYIHIYIPEERAGRWLLEHWHEPATPPEYPDPGDTGVRRHWHLPGFAYVESNGTTFTSTPQSFSLSGSGRVTYAASRGVTAPHAALVVLFALLPTFHVIGSRRRARIRRRIAQGRCATCGYDLRGTPQENPCPECGAAR